MLFILPKLPTITIYCVLPRLPKPTSIADFGVKDTLFKRRFFNINRLHQLGKLI